METLKIKKVNMVNPKTKEKGYTVRTVSNGKISYEQIAKEMCQNTTLNQHEARLAAGLLIEKIAEYIRNGYTVELGEVGSVRPSCTSKWAATEDELTKDIVKPTLVFNPSDEVESAIRGAKLQWVKAEDEETDSETPDSGDNNQPEELG